MLGLDLKLIAALDYLPYDISHFTKQPQHNDGKFDMRELLSNALAGSGREG